MTPQELERMKKLELLVQSLVQCKNLEFIASAERHLNFLSGSFRLSDAGDVAETAPSSGQVLKYDGTQWAPGTDIDT